MKYKLCFINQSQYGFHTDYVQYCKYLKQDFDIQYICWDYEKDRIDEEGIKTHYISRRGNILFRNFSFLKTLIVFLHKNSFNFIFIHYFRGCSIIPLFLKNRCHIHLDIRTGCISPNSLQRYLNNLLIRLESYSFKSISIISEGLRAMLKISKRAYILPLGADPIILNRRPDHKLSLIYVGTYGNRRLEDTVEGLAKYVNSNSNPDVYYTILGEGWGDEEEQIREKIRINNLGKYVNLEGYVPHKKLKQYFEKANIGISYIPIKPFFEHQPSTKTFEYLMSGMPVIATGTLENKKIINDINGIIIDDTPESFCEGLSTLNKMIGKFNEVLIRETVVDYKWETIVRSLNEYIREVCIKVNKNRRDF